MKKVLFLLLILGVFGCKNTKQTSTSDSATQEVSAVDTDKLPVLEFTKSPCYGTCPNYDAKIYSDGRMIYNGKRFVKLEGQFTLRMPDYFVKELLSKADEIKFYNFNDRYDEHITDVPSTTTVINNKKQSKTVYARAGIPDELNDFNRWIHQEIMKVTEPNAEQLMERQKNIQQNKLKTAPVKNDKPNN